MHSRDQRPQRRFIPTPVGNTTTSSPTPKTSPVHPHARGEHDTGLLRLVRAAGSSPRPWGTPPINTHPPARERFIPTPVGNTAGLRGNCLTWPVHPHARGEHAGRTVTFSYSTGSSPRPWGTRRIAHQAPLCRRFIPTPVGNTLPPCQFGIDPPVHPHARGEHARNIVMDSSTRGSSPRPWGTLH